MVDSVVFSDKLGDELEKRGVKHAYVLKVFMRRVLPLFFRKRLSRAYASPVPNRMLVASLLVFLL